MTLSQIDQLRSDLGEPIPVGGDESDTLFTDEQIQDFLGRGNGSLTSSAFYGWTAKAALLANLVDIARGSSRDSLSQLHKQALAQVELYHRLSSSSTGRTRIGTIRRTEGGAR